MNTYEGSQGSEFPSADAEAHEREAFQSDLSALLDNELDERAMGRTMERLESDAECREFFSSIQRSLEAHREVSSQGLDANADGFFAGTFRELLGSKAERTLEDRQLAHRLAVIFYQLGKAYVLAGCDSDWRQRVFERSVEVDHQRATGRGFVDGIAERAEGDRAGFDWAAKRHLLNGTLEKILAPFEKARRMLQECLEIESDYEPAILWLANLDRLEERPLRAARGFERVFEEGISPSNRAHAAMQLGKFHAAEHNYQEALRYFRWVGLSGELRRDRRFFPAGFNTGACYVHLGKTEHALETFRTLLDEHPERISELAAFFTGAPSLQKAVSKQPGFLEALFERCPELFQPGTTSSPDSDSSLGL